jgi:hypothetical protein
MIIFKYIDLTKMENIMLKLILISVLTISSAFAVDYERKSESFTISQFAGNGARVFYNCDSVEDAVTQTLEDMGAIVRSVRCTGGLDRFGNFHTAARVKTTFDALNSEIDGNISSSIQSVEIKNSNSCHLYNSIFKGISDSFEVSKVDMRKCNRPSARTRIKLQIRKAN